MTQNATWCQNRGCICISSVRRTYGRIHIPASTIILWTELLPKKRREKIQGEILQSSVQLESKSVSSNSTRITRFLRTTVFPHAIQQLQDILHTELILLQEFSKKYYNYKAHPVSPRADYYKASSSNCSPCIQAFYMAESSSKHPRIGRVEEEF